MSETRPFIALLTGYQNRLYAYILTMLGDPAAAEDVLQQANLVIWEKASQFKPGTDFEAWVMTIARFEVRAYRTQRGRDRLVLSDAALDRLQTLAETMPARLDARVELLHDCFGRLSDRQRDLLGRRYKEDDSIDRIAEVTDQPRSVVAQALYRARQALVRCMQSKAMKGGPA